MMTVVPYADQEKDMRLLFSKQDGLYKLYNEETFYGIAEAKQGKIKAKTKLC